MPERSVLLIGKGNLQLLGIEYRTNQEKLGRWESRNHNPREENRKSGLNKIWGGHFLRVDIYLLLEGSTAP